MWWFSDNQIITRTFTVSSFSFISTGAANVKGIGLEVGGAAANVDVDGADVPIVGVDVDGANVPVAGVDVDCAGASTGLLVAAQSC